MFIKAYTVISLFVVVNGLKKYQGEHFAMWWIRAGHLPTIEEGKAKLEYLELHGDTPECFTFAEPYSPPVDQKHLIDRYISAYNTFDIDRMIFFIASRS